MKYVLILLLSTIAAGCLKQNDDNTDAVGGNLPTNYIKITETGFEPASLSIVAGNNITFLNTTAAAKTIMTVDTVTIPRTTIEPNKSYMFKKDTTGIFYYVNTANSLTGVFILKP